MDRLAKQVVQRLQSYKKNEGSYCALKTLFQEQDAACAHFIALLCEQELYLERRVHAGFLSVLESIALDVKMISCHENTPDALHYVVQTEEEGTQRSIWAVGWKLVHCWISTCLSEAWTSRLESLDEVPPCLVQVCRRTGLQGQCLLDHITRHSPYCFKIVQEVLPGGSETCVMRITHQERVALGGSQRERSARRLLLSSIAAAHSFMKQYFVGHDALNRGRASHSFSEEAIHYLAASVTSDSSFRRGLQLERLASVFARDPEFFETMRRAVSQARDLIYDRTPEQVRRASAESDRKRLLPPRAPISRRTARGEVIFLPSGDINGWSYEACQLMPPSLALEALAQNGPCALDHARACDYMVRMSESGSARHTVVLRFSCMGAEYRLRQALDTVAAIYPELLQIFDPPLWLKGANSEQKEQLYLFITCQLLHCVNSLLLGHVSERWERFPSRVIMCPLLTRGMCCMPLMRVSTPSTPYSPEDNMLLNCSRYACLRSLLSWVTSHLDLELLLLKPHDPLFFMYEYVLRIVHRWEGPALLQAEVNTLLACCLRKKQVESFRDSHEEGSRLPEELQAEPPERPPHIQSRLNSRLQEEEEEKAPYGPEEAQDSDDEMDDIIDGGYGSNDSRAELPHDSQKWRGPSADRRWLRRWKSDPISERNLLGILVDYITGIRKPHMMVTHKLRHIFVFTNSFCSWAAKLQRHYPELYVWLRTLDYHIVSGGYSTPHILVALEPRNESQAQLFPGMANLEERNIALCLQLYIALCDKRLFSNAVARNLLRGLRLANLKDVVELRVPSSVCRKQRLPLHITQRLQCYNECCVIQFQEVEGNLLPDMNIPAHQYSPEAYQAAYQTRMSYNAYTGESMQRACVAHFYELLQYLEWSLFYRKLDVMRQAMERYLAPEVEAKRRSRSDDSHIGQLPLLMPYGRAILDINVLVSSLHGVSLLMCVLPDGRRRFSESGLLIPPESGSREHRELRNTLARYDAVGSHLLSKERSIQEDIFRSVAAHSQRQQSRKRRHQCAEEAEELASQSAFPHLFQAGEALEQRRLVGLSEKRLRIQAH